DHVLEIRLERGNRQHSENYVTPNCQFRGRPGRTTSDTFEFFRSSRNCVEGGSVESFGGRILCHATPHSAHSDKTNVHIYRPSLNRVYLVAITASYSLMFSDGTGPRTGSPAALQAAARAARPAIG